MNQINLFAIQWWQWMGAMLWQAGLLIGIISVIDFFIRKWAWPQVRYGLWLLVLLKLILPPTWSSEVSLISQARPQIHQRVNQTLGLVPYHPSAQTSMARTSAPELPLTGLQAHGSPSSAEPRTADPVESPDLPAASGPAWQTIALFIWTAGVLIFSALLLLKMSMLRRWHDQQDEKSMPSWFHEMLVDTASYFDLTHLPAIVFHKQVKTPAVYGLFKPVMLLPAGYFNGLSKKEARHVLLHELAHLKRGDLWLHGLCLFLQIVYWMNPLLVWVRNQMKTVREICCDLTVANVLKEETKEYRQTLLNTAREMLTENMSPGLGLLGVFEDPFKLITRLKWLEKKTWKQRNLMRATALFISLGLTAAVVPMASVHSLAEEPEGFLSATMFSDGDGWKLKPSSGSETDAVHLDIRLKQVPPLYAAVLPMTGSETQALESAAAALETALKAQKIKATGPLFGRYISDPEKVLPQNHMWEIGVPVKPGTRIKPPLQTIRVNAMQMASASVEGIRETKDLWDKFIKQMQDEDLIPCFPPAIENYTSPSEDKPFWWHTELQIQVFRPGEGYPGLQITTRETEPQTAVILPVKGDYYQHAQVLEQLKQYLKNKGIKPAGPAFGLYYTDEKEIRRENLFWEVGIPVKKDVFVEAPYELREMESRLVASARFSGPFTMEHPWSPFLMQIILNGQLPGIPGIEIWHEDQKEPFTELQIGVIKYETIGRGIQEWAEEFAENIAKSEKSMSGGMFENHPEENNGLYPIQTAPPKWLIVYPIRGSYEQAPSAFEKLKNYLKSKNIKNPGIPMMRQYNSEGINPTYNLLWEAAFRLEDSIRVELPYKVIKTPPREVIRFKISEGHDNALWTRQFSAWLYHNNYQPVVPHHLLLTHGLFQQGKPVPPLEVEIEIRRVDPPYDEVRLETDFYHAEKVLLLPVTGPADETKEREAIRRLEIYAREHQIKSTGSPFIRYLNNSDMVTDEELRWQAGIFLVHNQNPETALPYQIEHIPEGLRCSTTITCNTLKIPDRDWYAFTLNFTLNGYTPKEYPWKVMRQTEKKPYVMELCWPVHQQ